MPVDLIAHLVSAAFAEVRTGLMSQHNTIASELPEIPKDVIIRIREANRALLEELAQTPLPAPLVAMLREIETRAQAELAAGEA